MIIKNWCCGVVKVLIFQKYILKYLQMNDIISKICFKIIQWGQEWREVGRNLDETRLVILYYFIYLKVSIIKRFFKYTASTALM